MLTGHDAHRRSRCSPAAPAQKLAAVIDELRLVKDDWEISRLQHACDATARGFADVVREIPLVLDRPVRGERWLEGTFWRRARLEGNEVGYTSIVGSGANGTTLHWWRNNGQLRSGDLLLADMGVETEEIHTADVTRTFPLTGEWSPTQRKVYAAVLEAQEAGIAECRVGNDFLAANRACMRVLAEHLHSWGILDVTPDVSCSDDPEQPGRRSPPPLDAARGLAQPRPGRPRLRPGPRGGLHARPARRQPRPDRRAGPVLPGQRPVRPGRVPRDQRAHRGRHPGDAQRPGEPLRGTPPRPGRDHRVDARGPGHVAPSPSDCLQPRRPSVLGTGRASRAGRRPPGTRRCRPGVGGPGRGTPRPGRTARAAAAVRSAQSGVFGWAASGRRDAGRPRTRRCSSGLVARAQAMPSSIVRP